MILAGVGRLLCRTAEGFGRHIRPAVEFSRPLASRSVYLHAIASMHGRSIAGRAVANTSGIPIWVDCDAGSDDAVGIMLAVVANLVGISSVRGNTAAEQVSNNVLRVLTLCSRQDVPVYTGEDKSLNGRQQPIPKWSGQDGLNDQPAIFPASDSISSKPTPGIASDKMSDAAQHHAGQLVIIALGPLTNLAVALQCHPDLAANVKRLVIMGGNEAYNDYTSTGAEFNFYCDPDAAEEVIRKFAGKTTLLTWECMQRNPLPQSFARALAQKDSNKARFVSAICDLESVASKQEEKWVPCDPLAVAAALDSSVITGATDVLCKVEIKDPDKRGQTYFHKTAEELRTSEVCGYMVSRVTQVDTDVFSAMMKVSTDD